MFATFTSVEFVPWGKTGRLHAISWLLNCLFMASCATNKDSLLLNITITTINKIAFISVWLFLHHFYTCVNVCSSLQHVSFYSVRYVQWHFILGLESIFQGQRVVLYIAEYSVICFIGHLRFLLIYIHWNLHQFALFNTKVELVILWMSNIIRSKYY